MDAAPLNPTIFGRRLYLLGQHWRREIDRRMRAFGLSDATWRPLLYLGRYGDGMRQTDLAAALDIEGPSLVRLLDHLAHAGLIERRAETADRRAKRLHLTDAGHAIYHRVTSTYEAVAATLLADVPPADLAACDRVFTAIDAALQAQSEDRP